MQRLARQLAHRRAAIIVGVAVVLVYVVSILGLNFATLRTVFGSSVFSGNAKLTSLWAIISNPGTSMTLLTLIPTLATGALIGILLELTLQFRTKFGANSPDTAKSSGTGIAGAIAGVLGLGCAACGTALIAPLLALVGAGGLLTALPLHGGEFLMLGVVLLGYAVLSLSKKLETPAICAS